MNFEVVFYLFMKKIRIYFHRYLHKSSVMLMIIIYADVNFH